MHAETVNAPLSKIKFDISLSKYVLTIFWWSQDANLIKSLIRRIIELDPSTGGNPMKQF